MREPLFFNRQIRDADNLPFAWEDWARQGLVRVSDLRSLVHGPAPHDASFQQRIETLLAALLEPWQRLIRSEPPAAPWLTSGLVTVSRKNLHMHLHSQNDLEHSFRW